MPQLEAMRYRPGSGWAHQKPTKLGGAWNPTILNGDFLGDGADGIGSHTMMGDVPAVETPR